MFIIFFFFFFNDPAITEIYTLSLHDALPIWGDTDGSGRWPARDGLRIEPSRHERVRMLGGGRLAQSSPGIYRRRTTFGLSRTLNTAIAVIGIDIGKNSFHVVGHDARGAIVLRQKWSRGQVEARLANIPPC